MEVPVKVLNNGVKMPMIGLGTWQSPQGEVKQAVLDAIAAGYRHIDCAAVYLNEQEVGEALKEQKTCKREELFITSKLWNTHHAKEHVRAACLQTLKHLQLDYLDLYLIHWPLPFAFAGLELSPNNLAPKEGDNIKLAPVSLRETWTEMEKLVEEGLVKSIGVSNFNLQLVLELLSYCKIKPVCNQVEIQPLLQQSALVSQLEKHGNIATVGYSPLGSTGTNVLKLPIFEELSKKYNKSPAQIALRWSTQKGVVVLPKSVHKSRIEENFHIFDFEISSEDMERIAKEDKNSRVVNPLYFWNFGIFA